LFFGDAINTLNNSGCADSQLWRDINQVFTVFQRIGVTPNLIAGVSNRGRNFQRIERIDTKAIGPI
jgi:hypothetical protein